jgi:hypothetical protein
MSKKLVPRDKSRVAHAAKREVKAPAKAPAKAQPRARHNQSAPNRARSVKAAPQKTGIAGFFQRLFGRFRK